MISGELKIPYALDGFQNLVSVTDAVKSRYYCCPACGDDVAFRIGQIRQPHFSHFPSSSCSEETILHKTAKLLMYLKFRSALNGTGTWPNIVAPCRDCGHLLSIEYWHGATDVKSETITYENRVGDVVLLSDGVVTFDLEVYVTHRVDKQQFTEANFEIAEIAGDEIVRSPDRLVSTNHNFDKLMCEKCRTVALVREVTYDKYMVQVKKVMKSRGVIAKLDILPVELRNCSACGAEIPVFELSQATTDDMPSNAKVPTEKGWKHLSAVIVCSNCGAFQTPIDTHARNSTATSNEVELKKRAFAMTSDFAERYYFWKGKAAQH